MVRVQFSPDAATKAVVSACFPSYRGRKYRLNVQTHPLNVKSSWSGGSRDQFVFFNLETRTVFQVPPQSAFDKQIKGADTVTLPDGIVCVSHSIFMGKDSGITIHVNPANVAAMLPAGGVQ
jgi:hypothetical protein